MRKFTAVCAIAVGIAFAAPVFAHENVLTLDQMLELFGWDFEKTDIKTEKVADNLHVLFGLGGNIAVSSGDDGVLIVDDQFPQLMPKIKTALGELGSDKVDFAINTHWHFDHADGNLALGKEGTWIVSHAASREKMLSDNLIDFGPFAYEQKAYPKDARSVITYDTTMQFHFNGEKIDLVHAGPAHTTGDTAVIFRGQNAVHLGDVFNFSGYPFIDADNGGDLSGMIEFCQVVHDMIDDETIVIPGHGPITNRAKLKRYIEILSIVRERMMALINQGKTYEEIVATKPTGEFDFEMKANPGNLDVFLNRSYVSLTREKSHN